MTLAAQMTLPQILKAARASERYYHDADFHLLTDWVDRLSQALETAQEELDDLKRIGP